MAALFENPPLQCFGLQTELRAADREVLHGLPNLTHLGDDIRDFADTAAIISLLDVVISVDTAVAHLAGALGKPVIDSAALCGGFPLDAAAQGHAVVSDGD